MKSLKKSKLGLSTETLRALTRTELEAAAGGFTNISNSCACHSFICSIGGNCTTVKCPAQGGGGGW
jgi:hypothetical protein